MKTLRNTIALGTLALGLASHSAFADDAVLVPTAFRCTSCGAQYQVKTKVMKDNSIQIKLEPVAKKGNPKNG